MPENYSNRYQTSLAGAVTAGALTGSVASVTGIPSTPFRAIISAEGGHGDEIVLVTAVAGSALTWTRAVEPVAGVQVASAHSSGATLTAIVTAAQLARMDVGMYDVTRYGASPSASGATNSAAMQAAIQAAFTAGGGQVFIPAGTYTLASSLVMRRGVSIKGIYPGVTPRHAGSWDIGFTISTGTILTYPGGTVFTQDMSAGNGTLPAVDGIVIECLGFNDVGTILSCGATNKTGLAGSVIRDILGSNISGYALDLTNIMHVNVTNVKVSDAYGLLRTTGDYDSAVINHGPGNSQFDDMYCYTTAAGHPFPTILIRTLNPNGNGTTMGCPRFRNIQVNRWLSTSKVGNHISIEGATLAAQVSAGFFDMLDLEGYADSLFSISNGQKARISMLTASVAGQANSDLKLRNAQFVSIWTQDFIKIDADVTDMPFFLFGAMGSITGGYLPTGMYLTANQVNLSMGDLAYTAAVQTDLSSTWTMPFTHLNFDTSLGGGIREHYISWNASTLTADITFFGIIDLPYVGAMSVTLMSAVGSRGQTVTLKKTGASGTITVSGTGGQTIDGAASNVWLDTQYKFLTLQSNGANWLIVAKG